MVSVSEPFIYFIHLVYYVRMYTIRILIGRPRHVSVCTIIPYIPYIQTKLTSIYSQTLHAIMSEYICVWKGHKHVLIYYIFEVETDRIICQALSWQIDFYKWVLGVCLVYFNSTLKIHLRTILERKVDTFIYSHKFFCVY